MRSPIFTAIDIGSHSIIGLCAKKDRRTGKVDILAKSQSPCFGVRNGEVIKPLEVARAINWVVGQLSETSGIKIKDALVNISGSHLFSISSQGLVSVSRADQKISKEDIQRVLKAAQAVNLPSNKEILTVIPKEYIVDGEGGIKDPLGLKGIRLEAKVLLPCLFSPVLENLDKAMAEAGLTVLDFIPTPLASSKAVLSPEQKELGVALVDIGAGTTSLAVFEKGDLVNFAIFPIGSANITNDIAICLRTEIKTAEKIKKEFATLKKGSRKGIKDKIEIPERSLSFSNKLLQNIVEARVNDIFSQIEKSLKKMTSGEPLPAGIVLTGGGSKLPGLVDFVKQKFKLPSMNGSLVHFPNTHEPECAVCLGLLLTAFDSEEDQLGNITETSKISARIKRIFKSFLP